MCVCVNIYIYTYIYIYIYIYLADNMDNTKQVVKVILTLILKSDYAIKVRNSISIILVSLVFSTIRLWSVLKLNK